MNAKHVLVPAAAWWLAANPCLAHDTWLLPREARAVDARPMVLDLTSGMSFPRRESPIKPDRVASGGWRLGNRSGEIDAAQEDDSSLVVTVTPQGGGTAVLFVSLNPRDIDLEPAEVEHYFEEIGAPETVRKAWEEAGPDAKFHETYTKFAKTFARVGDGAADPTCMRPVGFVVEFLPDRDPTTLKVGDTLVVKAVRGGNEMESFAVGSTCAAGDAALNWTSKAGKVSVSICHGGWWLVRGTELHRDRDGSWRSEFTTMTFFVED